VPEINALEQLAFGALISAVDPVATLSILGGVGTDPVIYSIIFGESVLNDAVAIVLFETFQVLLNRTAPVTWIDLWTFFYTFCEISLGSIALGIGIGMATAAVMLRLLRLCFFFFRLLISILQFIKHVNVKVHSYFEVSFMVCFAYISYATGQLLGLSGIISIFFTGSRIFSFVRSLTDAGIMMQHYHLYSLSDEARAGTQMIFKLLAFISESLVFLYLGVSVFQTFTPLVWDYKLILITMGLCLLGRAVNIFPLSFVANFWRKQKIAGKHQFFLWFSGLRGAMAFAMAINFPGQYRPYVAATTLAIVLFTTLFQGPQTYLWAKKLGLLQQPEEMIPMKPEHESLLGRYSNRKYGRFHSAWRAFDERFMKPIFGGAPRTKVEPPEDNENESALDWGL
jgi:sodium/hydrogen exchanger 8